MPSVGIFDLCLGRASDEESSEFSDFGGGGGDAVVVLGNLQDSYQQFQYQLSCKLARWAECASRYWWDCSRVSCLCDCACRKRALLYAHAHVLADRRLKV